MRTTYTRKINMRKIDCDWCLPGSPGTYRVTEHNSGGYTGVWHSNACGHHLRVFFPPEALPAPLPGAVSMVKSTSTPVEYWIPVGGNALQMSCPGEIRDLMRQGFRPDVRIMPRPQWRA